MQKDMLIIMKRILIFLTAAMLLISLLAGCRGKGSGTAGGSASAGAPGSGSSDSSNADTTNSGTDTGTTAPTSTEGIGGVIDEMPDVFENAAGNTIDGTPDGADTYGATDDTNLDDMR